MTLKDRILSAACSLRGARHVLPIGLTLLSMAFVPVTASAQWTPGPSGSIYYSGGSVGIGTPNPQSTLELGGLAPEMRISHVAGYFESGYPHLRLLYNNTEFLKINMDGYYSTVFNTTASAGTGHITFFPKGNVGIGTPSPQYKLAVNGNIGAQDIIVTNLGWSDYVFRPAYRLPPLSEVKAYIQANHHLPDIPSEAEVKALGVSVAEMQSKLLAKIEELTLHMIRADETNTTLEEQNRELRDDIRELKARISR